MTPDEQLMADIKAKYGAQIDAAVAGTAFPASLVAALTANETGLDYTATRLEPAVLGDLCLVLVGRKQYYGAISRAQLLDHFPPSFKPDQFATALINLAMSWGPTQIMGFQSLAGGYPLSELAQPAKHFPHTVQMLEAFAKQFNLVVDVTTPDSGNVRGQTVNFEGLFRCWNSGRPDGKTFDPNYAAKGLARMVAYEALTQ